MIRFLKQNVFSIVLGLIIMTWAVWTVIFYFAPHSEVVSLVMHEIEPEPMPPMQYKGFDGI
jgi:hypothetical protein